MHRDNDRPLFFPHHIGLDAHGDKAIVKRIGIGAIPRMARRLTAFFFKKIKCDIESRQSLHRWREAEGTKARAFRMGQHIGQIKAPGPRLPGPCLDAINPRHRKANARHAFQAFAGSEHQRIAFGVLGHIEGQSAKGGNRIHDHAPPGVAHRAPNTRRIIHNAAAGFAIDEGHMADRGISRQHRGDIFFPRAARIGQVERHHIAPNLTRNAFHARRIGTIHRDQQLAIRRHQASDRRFHHEMPAALQRQRHMFPGDAARDITHPFTNARIGRAEAMIPRGDILSHGGAGFGAGLHGTGNEQHHAPSHARPIRR